MSADTLFDLEIVNFRSIRGRLNAPLDSKVVLIHGENGAGKTSFLSAIELALTGQVQALRRADPNYVTQLLHRNATTGSVEVRMTGESGPATYRSTLQASGLALGPKLSPGLANFFAERCYLPQSLLGQLLQIYQESGSDIDSPLARFVGSLLGLDRLDALEAGLKALSDVRNVRKIAEGWSNAEIEKNRLDRSLADKLSRRSAIVGEIAKAKSDLAASASELGYAYDPTGEEFETIDAAFLENADEQSSQQLTERRRELVAIRREADRAADLDTTIDEAALNGAAAKAAAALTAWQEANGSSVGEVRAKVLALLPNVSFSQDHAAFYDEAITALRLQQSQANENSKRSATDAARQVVADDELAVARQQLATIDLEVGRLSESSSGLSSALAELTAYISDNVCPVCDRDYGELNAGSLTEHVHRKVRNLSSSAERLLALSRSRGEQQATIDALERELSTLSSRQLEPRALADLARRSAAYDSIVAEIESLAGILAEGARLEAADIAARRALSEHHARDSAGRAGRQTLQEFASSAGQPGVQDGETIQGAADRLNSYLAAQLQLFEGRLLSRRRGREAIVAIRAALIRLQQMDASITEDEAALKQVELAQKRGQTVRDGGSRLRSSVDAVRSAIIRREFNERLNLLWRDLFVRLAPGEPFVPAFSIPSSQTQRLQPKLVTLHRDGGDAGGTPGAMLSAGNLNTAALTLFMALHLSVPVQLPWLILDDPVQSMDDVHIAHFAALLRTLAKDHGRQVIIAVHDRQLFEYLRLELSPAYPEDSLLTLELSRSARRDTVCLSDRLTYREETALRNAA